MKKTKKDWKKIAKYFKSEYKELVKIVDTLEDECLVWKDKYNTLADTKGYNEEFLRDDLSLNEKIAFLINQTNKHMEQSPYSKELGLTNWLQNRTNYFITYLRVLRTGGTDFQKYTIEQIDKANEEKKKALEEKAAIESKYNKLVQDIKLHQEINGKINLLEVI